MESRLCRREKVIKFLREEMGVKKIRFPDIAVSVLSRVRKKAPNVWFVRDRIRNC